MNCFPESANLICRSTDISICFIESIGVRDNESQLYNQILRSDGVGLIRSGYSYLS